MPLCIQCDNEVVRTYDSRGDQVCMECYVGTYGKAPNERVLEAKKIEKYDLSLPQTIVPTSGDTLNINITSEELTLINIARLEHFSESAEISFLTLSEEARMKWFSTFLKLTQFTRRIEETFTRKQSKLKIHIELTEESTELIKKTEKIRFDAKDKKEERIAKAFLTEDEKIIKACYSKGKVLRERFGQETFAKEVVLRAYPNLTFERALAAIESYDLKQAKKGNS